MVLDTQVLLSLAAIVIGAFWGLIVWNFKKLDAEVKDLLTKLAAHELHSAQSFATHDDVDRSATRLEKLVEQISKKLDLFFEKLDNKADKK